jgi:hypothetical protein
MLRFSWGFSRKFCSIVALHSPVAALGFRWSLVTDSCYEQVLQDT